MHDLAGYLDVIVQPTFADFIKNPKSERHAFLACVATYHATYPRKPRGLLQKWRQKSAEYAIVDMIAHHFKHVRSDAELQTSKIEAIPLSALLFNPADVSASTQNELIIDLHNLRFVIRDAIKFVQSQVTPKC
jgi:hypothetical protein